MELLTSDDLCLQLSNNARKTYEQKYKIKKKKKCYDMIIQNL